MPIFIYMLNFIKIKIMYIIIKIKISQKKNKIHIKNHRKIKPKNYTTHTDDKIICKCQQFYNT